MIYFFLNSLLWIPTPTPTPTFDCVYQVWYGFVAFSIIRRDGMDGRWRLLLFFQRRTPAGPAATAAALVKAMAMAMATATVTTKNGYENGYGNGYSNDGGNRNSNSNNNSNNNNNNNRNLQFTQSSRDFVREQFVITMHRRRHHHRDKTNAGW